MQTRPLGASGLHVSRLGLGTMSWGRDVEWATARDLLAEFVGAGGNLVDTAPAYGAGVAEKMIGKAIAGGLPRESLVIATKADKLGKNACAKQVALIRQMLGVAELSVLPYSSVKNEGRSDLLDVIWDTLLQ